MDFHAKQDMIEAIDSEVDGLHPLLQSFLGKLEFILNCEYTHGPQEKGADFVLTRTDPALGTISYVGVVAKRGKITNDTSDIDRQIQECQLPRLINSGKTKVRLTEVWVINTNSISANAKDKIYETYTKQKIEFINSEGLTKLVDKYANFFWYQVPSPIGTYLETVSRELVALEKVSGLVGSISCEDFFIEPDIQEIEKISYVKNKRPRKSKLVSLVDEIFDNKVSVLEAEMGFGKSRLSRHICQSFCAPEAFNHRKIIPIHTSFRRFHESRKTLSELTENTLSALTPAVDLGEVKILIVLDGIDEAATDDSWKDCLKATISAAKADPRIHLLLTTRPLKVIDEEIDIYEGVKRFSLRPLSLAKIILFIEKACQNISVPKKIFDDLRRSDLFKQLPQSPIAAALLSSLIAQNQNDLPSNLTELFTKSVDYMLGRWDIQKGNAVEKEFQAAEKVSLSISNYMVGNKLIWMSFKEADSVLTKWFEKRNITGLTVEQLRDRVFNKSGLFSIDHEDNTLSFRHRSFGEYLYAREQRQSTTQLDVTKAFDPYWVESTFFHIGLMGDCKDLLSTLLGTVGKTEEEQWVKILSLPDYLLAGYQTEYSLIEENLYTLFIEAALLYERILAGDTKTRLKDLSEMHLLWLFQLLIRHSFDYDFLRPSITNTILKIDADLTVGAGKFYALFFAACFAAQLDDPSGFEFILREYPIEAIPLPISLAIRLETKTKKDFTKIPLVKSHEKRLKKLLMGAAPGNKKSGTKSSEVDARMAELFERPIRTRTSTVPKNRLEISK